MKLKEKEIEVRLVQIITEENLWKMVKSTKGREKKEEDEVAGLVITYVDDVAIAGEEVVANAMLEKFRETNPEWVGSKTVRFLGMNLKTREEEDGRSKMIITQKFYGKTLSRSSRRSKED